MEVRVFLGIFRGPGGVPKGLSRGPGGDPGGEASGRPKTGHFWGVFGSKKCSFKHPPEGGAQARWVA
jgi:hypothetical protein